MRKNRNGRFELFQGQIKEQLSQMEEERQGSHRSEGKRVGLLGILLALGLVFSIVVRFWMGV